MLGQAKAGVGKTAVFVLAVLHQIEPEEGKVSALVIAHTRELAQQVCSLYVGLRSSNVAATHRLNPAVTRLPPRASIHLRIYQTVQDAVNACWRPCCGEMSRSEGRTERVLCVQIEAEFKRFSKFIEPEVRIANYVGGIARKLNEDELKETSTRPHIVIGTPGRLSDLAESGKMPLGDIKFFIVDECDKVLDQLGAQPLSVTVLQLAVHVMAFAHHTFVLACGQ